MEQILLAILPTNAMLPAVLHEQESLSDKIELNVFFSEEENCSVSSGTAEETDSNLESAYVTSDFGYAETQQTATIKND